MAEKEYLVGLGAIKRGLRQALQDGLATKGEVVADDDLRYAKHHHYVVKGSVEVNGVVVDGKQVVLGEPCGELRVDDAATRNTHIVSAAKVSRFRIF